MESKISMTPQITKEQRGNDNTHSDISEKPLQSERKTNCHSAQPDPTKATSQHKPTMSRLKYNIQRPYIVFWHELSMDPRVRLSPWSPPPKDEVKLSRTQISLARQRRVYFLSVHILALVGMYHCFTGKVSFLTGLWALLLGAASSIGVTAGAHRLWSHHSFKATWPLRLILAAFQTTALQFSVLHWVRDHRLHHKFVDTDADPHNSRRGFFFSHIGWLLVVPHPQVLKNKKTIDTSDVEKDLVVKYQDRYYLPLSLILCYVIPTVVPWYFWGEDLWTSHLVAGHLRHILILHGTFMINSAAHMWGTKPYDKNICPTENMLVSFTSFGDGWHNYHHVFPWDYKNAELWDYKLNLSAAFVDAFAPIGWAYDLKTVPTEMVAKRVRKTGDGTHPLHHHGAPVWGWNDKDLDQKDRELTSIEFPEKPWLTRNEQLCRQNEKQR